MRIGMLKQLRRHLSINKFKILVSGLFTSKLIYGIAAWGAVWGNNSRYQEDHQNSITMRKDDMRKLQVLQNSTLRLMLGKRYDYPTSSLLYESNSLSVNQTVAYSIMCQVWKIKTTTQPKYHYERLFGRLMNPEVSTRSIVSQETRINFKLSMGRGSFFYLGSNLWNSLPITIRESSTHQQLKRAARGWTLENIPMKAYRGILVKI